MSECVCGFVSCCAHLADEPEPCNLLLDLAEPRFRAASAIRVALEQELRLVLDIHYLTGQLSDLPPGFPDLDAFEQLPFFIHYCYPELQWIIEIP